MKVWINLVPRVPGLLSIFTVKSLKFEETKCFSELSSIGFALTKMAKDFVNSFNHSPFLVEVLRLY